MSSHFGFAWRVCLAAHELSKSLMIRALFVPACSAKLPFVKVAVICMREERKRKRRTMVSCLVVVHYNTDSLTSSSSPVVLMEKSL